MFDSKSLCVVAVACAAIGCSKKSAETEVSESGEVAAGAASGTAAGSGERLSSAQLSHLLPTKVGDYALHEAYGAFRDPAAMPISSVRVQYYAGDAPVSVAIIDCADSDELRDDVRKRIENGQVPTVKGETTTADGVVMFVGTSDYGGGMLKALVADRFDVEINGNQAADRDGVLAFWEASGLAQTLASPPAGLPDERAAWAKDANEDAPPPERTQPDADETPPTIADEDTPACDELLTGAQLAKACGGKKLKLGDTGMADGKSQVCSAGAGGFIFLLSRLASAEQARRAAGVALDDSADAVEDRTVQVKEWPTGGHVAVAATSNLLLELRSLDHRGAPPICDRAELQALAEQIVDRLPSPE